jgi:hypothetical protein
LGFRVSGDLGDTFTNWQNFRISEKPEIWVDTLHFFFRCFSCFQCTALRKKWNPKTKMTLLGIVPFPQIFRVFRGFQDFQLRIGKISEKGVFSTFWKKKHFSNHQLSLRSTFTWGENLNIGHKKTDTFFRILHFRTINAKFLEKKKDVQLKITL